MKAAKTIEFSEVTEIGTYIVTVEQDYNTEVLKGTGTEVLDMLEEIFDFDSNNEDQGEFITRAESLNGDGWPVVEVYSI